MNQCAYTLPRSLELECPTCSQLFPDMKSLTAHEVACSSPLSPPQNTSSTSDHKAGSSEDEDTQPPRSVRRVCLKCRAVFHSDEGLERHVATCRRTKSHVETEWLVSADESTASERTRSPCEYSCPLCQAEFSSPSDLGVHVTQHSSAPRKLDQLPPVRSTPPAVNGLKRLICPTCKRLFLTAVELERHSQVCGRVKPPRSRSEDDGPSSKNRKGKFACLFCRARFPVKEPLGAHMLSDHVRELQGAPMWEDSYSRSGRLRGMRREFVCPVCSVTFDSQREANKHVQVCRTGGRPANGGDTRNGKQEVACKYCPLRFAEGIQTTLHMLEAHEDIVCGGSREEMLEVLFVGRTGGKRKREGESSEAGYLDSPNSDPYELSCVNCRQQFTYEDDLLMHQASCAHVPDPSAFPSRRPQATTDSAPEQPMEVECVKSRFMCPFCQKTNKYAGTMRKHMKTCVQMNGPPSYPPPRSSRVPEQYAGEVSCDVCSAQFVSLKDLTVHQVQWHSGQDRSDGHSRKHFACPYCLRSYKYVRSFEKHIKMCSPERMMQPSEPGVEMMGVADNGAKFGCAYCSEEFEDSRTMQDHLLRMHGRELRESAIADAGEQAEFAEEN